MNKVDSKPDKLAVSRDEQGKFVPGTSGNPNGRPLKGDTLTDAMRDFLGNTEIGDVRTRKDKFVEKVFNKALTDGDPVCIKLIWNYLDGMPKQEVDQNLNGNIMLNFDPALQLDGNTN